MKRILCAATALLLLLVLGPVPARAEETAIVRVDEAGVVGKVFALGDRVEVKAEQDGCYVVDGEDGDLLVEKWLIRMDTEAAAGSYIAYASGKTDVFSDPYLEQEKLVTLNLNNQLTVEDSFGTILRITLTDGRSGYVRASGVSRSPIVYGGGGGGGGSDGGDIPIANFGHPGATVSRLSSSIRRENEPPFAPGPGTIVAEGAEGYVALLNRGDTVFVKERTGDMCTVQAGEMTGTMPVGLLSFEDDPAFEPWDGFAQGNAPLHQHWRMLDEGKKLNMNTPVHIIGEILDRYIVEVNDVMGFIPADQVNKTPIVYSGGGGGDWTDPVL